jgi:hypothetical protein
VVVEDEADVVVEEVIDGGIMTVMPKRKEKESNWQWRKALRMPVRGVRRGDGLSSQMADLTSVYVEMSLLRSFKARRKPSWTMDLLLLRSRTNKELYRTPTPLLLCSPPPTCQTKRRDSIRKKRAVL